MKKIFILLIIILFTKEIALAEELNLNGNNYILMEEASGRVLMEKGSDVKMPMASTTKIMTAIIALEQGNLNDKIKIIGSKINIDGSSIYLKNGEVVTLKDLLYGLMLRSGNDAALAIANHISGSEKTFVEEMNKKALEIGAINTNFTNSHGLNNKQHYSTAHDMALITKYAFSVEGFKSISGSKSYKSSRKHNSLFINKNKGVFEYEGGDGVKIGYTEAAGRCLVSSAKRDGIRLIAVTLNDDNWFHDNYSLMDYGFNNFKQYVVYDKDKVIHRQNVYSGSKNKVSLIADKQLILPLTEGERFKVKLIIRDNNKIVKAPIAKGEILGSVEVYIDEKLVIVDNLIAKDDIDRKSFFDRLNDILRISIN